MQDDNHNQGIAVKSMDQKLKKSRPELEPCGVNILSSLPDELMSRIVSVLPFKEVAAMQALCKRIKIDIFTWITVVDLDDSPVSCCRQFPHQPNRFPLFVMFVDHVLNQLSQSGSPLTRFRLHVGGDTNNSNPGMDQSHACEGVCFPDLEPSRLNAWISYPLALLGLRELELSFHLMNPSDYRLPPQLFTSQSLEVLKLDSNLHLDAAEFSHISLPNLEILHLYSFFIVQDAFITKLVSCCPSLEVLVVNCCSWNQGDRLVISSHSLLRLDLVILKCDEVKNSGLVLIDTPNLQYFDYDANLAFHYYITNMNDLVQAEVYFRDPLEPDTFMLPLQSQLCLVRMLSNAQHLSLLGSFVENMCDGGVYEDQLPVFYNLKTLELGSNSHIERWDKVLLEILTSSPSLETLVFQEGFLDVFVPYHNIDPEVVEIVDLEKQGWKTIEVTPKCFESSLKRIVINNYMGIARELNIIKYLLSKASVLLELVVCVSPRAYGLCGHDHMLFKCMLKALPRASSTCSFRVSKKPY